MSERPSPTTAWCFDFITIKPVVRELLDELDEHWIVPGEHPVLRVEVGPSGTTEVRFGDRYYAAPERGRAGAADQQHEFGEPRHLGRP